MTNASGLVEKASASAPARVHRRIYPYLKSILYHTAQLTCGHNASVLQLSKEVDAKIAKSTANVDTANPKNGPDGKGCVHGIPVDAVLSNGSFTCSCDNAHEGDNCEVEVKASGASGGDDNTGTIVAVVVVLLLLAVCTSWLDVQLVSIDLFSLTAVFAAPVLVLHHVLL